MIAVRSSLGSKYVVVGGLHFFLVAGTIECLAMADTLGTEAWRMGADIHFICSVERYHAFELRVPELLRQP